jgi:WD40 repeat protein
MTRQVSWILALSLVALGLWLPGKSFGQARSDHIEESGNLPIKVEKDFDVQTPGAAVAVAWSADGTRLAAASDYDGTFTIWDQSGHLIKRIAHIGGGGPALNGSLAFLDGSSKLLFLPPAGSLDRAALSIWDIATEQVVRTLDGPRPEGDYAKNRGHYFMVSPDQSVLVSGTYSGDLIAYRTSDWKALQISKVEGGIFSLCVFGKDNLVSVGSTQERVTILNSATGALDKTLQIYDQSELGGFPIGQ